MTKQGILRERLLEGLILSPGERLWLYRRSLGKTQVQMAKRYHEGRETYRGWEEDVGKVPTVAARHVRVRRLPIGELCGLHLRRLGLTYEDLGHALEMSRTQAHQAAAGRKGIEKVVAFIQQQRQEESA